MKESIKAILTPCAVVMAGYASLAQASPELQANAPIPAFAGNARNYAVMR